MKKIIFLVLLLMVLTTWLFASVGEVAENPELLGIDLSVIITAIIGLVGLVFGATYWLKFKNLLRKIADLAEVISNAATDDVISKEELQEIIDSGEDVYESIMSFFQRKKTRRG